MFFIFLLGKLLLTCSPKIYLYRNWAAGQKMLVLLHLRVWHRKLRCFRPVNLFLELPPSLPWGVNIVLYNLFHTVSMVPYLGCRCWDTFLSALGNLQRLFVSFNWSFCRIVVFCCQALGFTQLQLLLFLLFCIQNTFPESIFLLEIKCFPHVSIIIISSSSLLSLPESHSCSFSVFSLSFFRFLLLEKSL